MKKIYIFLLFFFSLQANANSIELTNFISLINTDFREQKFQNMLKPYSSSIEMDKIEAGSTVFNLYKFRPDGLMINVANNKVLSIILYKEGEKGFRQFNGKMPFKINFAMTRGQIERTIGPPVECIGATTISNVKIDLNCTYAYTDLIKFMVTYDSQNPLDYQTKPILMAFASKNN